MSSQFIGPCRWPFRRQVQYPQLPAGGLLLPFGRGFIGCETMPPLYTNIAIWRQHDSFHAAGVSRNRRVAYTVLYFATIVWSLSTLNKKWRPGTPSTWTACATRDSFPFPLPSATEVLVPGLPWLRTCRSGPTEWSGLRMLWCGVELRHQSCSPLSVHPHKSDTGDEHGLGTGTLRCWECALRPPDQQPRPQSHRVGRTGPVLQGRFDDERHPPTHTRATATDDDKDPKPRHWISTGAPQGLFPRDNRVHVRRVRHRCRCATVWAPHAASRRQASASTSDISWIQPEDQRGAGTRATSLIWDAKEHARVFTSLLPLLAETIRSYEAANAGDIIIFATPGISAGVADPAVCTSA